MSVTVQAVDWILGAALAFGGFMFARRFGGGAALAELERANNVLERRVHELEAADAAKTRRIAELEASRDVSLAIVPVLAALQHHEEQAAHRADANLKVLGLIASKLGAEDGSE